MKPETVLSRLLDDGSGTVLVEIALIAPILVLLAIGGFEGGTLVMRHQELQSALNNGAAIALAANQGAETNTTELKTIIMDEVDLDEEQIALTKHFRCGTSSTLVTEAESCGSTEVVSEYVRFKIVETHQPLWTKIGFGDPIRLDLERMVQLS